MMLKWRLGSLNQVIAVSYFTKNEILRLTPSLGKKVQVIQNGVSEDWFEVKRNKPKDREFFLYVGNLKPHKNIRRLIEVYKSTMASHRHDIVVVGKVTGLATVDDISDLVNQGPRIRMLGQVADDELKRLYGEASALIFPSLYEGFGLPPLEAMALGCPVLASNIGSVSEVCGKEFDGIDGNVLYFDPENSESMRDAILRFIGLTDGECEKLERNGVAQAGKFSWKSSAEKTAKLLEGHLM